jgi:hypothetical protein
MSEDDQVMMGVLETLFRMELVTWTQWARVEWQLRVEYNGNR